ARRTPESVYAAMFGGAMTPQATGLSPEEGRAIARYLTGKEFVATAPPGSVGACSANPGTLPATGGEWNGWGNDLFNTRYQPEPGLRAEDVPRLKLKWAFAVAGDTSRPAQPAVFGGRVFVGGASGAVHSLDAATGCLHWTYQAGAGVRTAVSIGKLAGR